MEQTDGYPFSASGRALEEMGQLRTENVKVEDRVPCIYIRGGDGRRVKNRGSQRLIPLHPELIRLGFMTYVAQQRGAGKTRRFPELKPDRNGKLTEDVPFLPPRIQGRCTTCGSDRRDSRRAHRAHERQRWT